jgi:hypothetical protein
MNRCGVLPLYMALLTGVSVSVVARGGPILTLPVGVSPGSLTVSTYATGLSYPSSMQVLGNQSLLVGVSTPQPGSTDYLFSTGGLLNIPNAQSAGTVVYNSLPYPVQSVRAITGNLIAVAQAGSGANQINFLQPGASPGDPYSNLGSINFAPSDAGSDIFFNSTLAVRATPGQPGSYDLFFSVNGDTDHTQSTNHAVLGGLASGNLAYNTIDMVTVTPTGGAPIVSAPKEIASGVRNPAGMVFDSAGNLYLDDNGWDIPGTSTPQSADELDFIAASQIGNGVVDFGFPNSYVQYGTGNIIGGTGVEPLVAFQPIGGMQSLGASEIALAPTNFPDGLNDGLFISFYGKWEQGGANNTTGPLVYYSFATQQYEDVILSGQAGIGHIDSLVSTPDALFIGDMNSDGTVRSGPIDGAIYEIQAVGAPEPGTFVAGLGLLLIPFLRRKAS